MQNRTRHGPARTRARHTALFMTGLFAACQSTGAGEIPVVHSATTSTEPAYEPGLAPRVPISTAPPRSTQEGQGTQPGTPPSAETGPQDWQFHAGIYLWGAGLDGVASAGGTGIAINESFSDILDNLEFAGMAAFEGKRGQWGFRLDGIYLDLEGSSDGLLGTTETEIEALIAEADLLFSPRGNPGLDFIAGVRVLGIETEIDFPIGPTASGETTLIDPILGAQGTWDLGETWKFRLRGDVGGFGVGSEMTYQIFGFFRWAFAESWGLDFGYRLLGYDIKESDVDLDVQFQGLILGVDYAF